MAIHEVIADQVTLTDTAVAASTRTFTNGFDHNIPNPEDSYVVVLGTWTASNANADPTSCTVGGVSLTISGRFINNSGGSDGIGVLAFDVAATGDMTGDVVINFDDDVANLALVVFSIASDGTNFNVNGNNDGASPWDGVNFITASADVATISICAAVASETTDVSPVTAGAEVLTGSATGIVTGFLEWNCAAIRQTATDHDVQFDGGTGAAMLAYVSYGGLTDIPSDITVNVDQAVETDTALDIAPAKAVLLDLAVDTETALDIQPAKAVAVDQAVEVDTALDIAPAKAVAVDQAVEIDTALDIAPAKAVVLDIAIETDIAFALVMPIIVQVDIAIETDTAFDISVGGLSDPTITLAGQANELVQLAGAPIEISTLSGNAGAIEALKGSKS